MRPRRPVPDPSDPAVPRRRGPGGEWLPIESAAEMAEWCEEQGVTGAGMAEACDRVGGNFDAIDVLRERMRRRRERDARERDARR